ncbi:uncharacterized protein LOC110460001 [Mizuhopecten yessoensis]|uniref:uncharacterized protein LOC110460001 n=1 Tax=Mizuhopecten yessoensis TaxID=6573 RepID=UPI000B45EEB4|nr:uncharacterized protein LOC110460001 [Mizuhopecten yessoensis]
MAFKVTFIVQYKSDERRRSRRISFDGTSSSNTSWFASNRIIESTLLDKSTAANVFSIDRHPSRHFFINKYYGGCQNDYGWVVIADDHDTNYVCPWENSTSYPLIMCATDSTAINWSTNETNIATSVRILLHASLLNN